MTDQQAPDHIWVVGVREEQGVDRGFWDRRKVDREPVPVARLNDEMANLVGGMHQVIARIEAESERWQLDEVQVAVEIGAKGSVSLLGTGGEVSGTGGLTFTFKRS
jgi:hypothetical protein